MSLPTDEDDDRIVYFASTPFPRNEQDDEENKMKTQIAKQPSDKHSTLDDICCLAMICPKHANLALIDIPNKGIYFPYVSGRFENYSVNQIVRDLLYRLTGGQANFINHQLSVERIQIPNKISIGENETNFIVRFTYRIDVVNKNKEKRKKYKKKRQQQESSKNNNQERHEQQIKEENGDGEEEEEKGTNYCICQMATTNINSNSNQRTMPKIHWLSYEEICLKLSTTTTVCLPQHPISTTTTKAVSGTIITSAPGCNSNNLLGPEPKFVLEQWCQQQQTTATTTARPVSRIDPSLLLDSSCYYPSIWNEITFNDDIIQCYCSNNQMHSESCKEQQEEDSCYRNNNQKLVVDDEKRFKSRANQTSSSTSTSLVSSSSTRPYNNDNSCNQQIQEKHRTPLLVQENKKNSCCDHCVMLSYYKHEQIISLYNEYLLQCFPSKYMTLHTFRIFMLKVFSLKHFGFSRRRRRLRQTQVLRANKYFNDQQHEEYEHEIRIPQYFKSFDSQRLSFLHFEHLLLGMMVFSEKFARCFCGGNGADTADIADTAAPSMPNDDNIEQNYYCNDQQQHQNKLCSICQRMKYEFIFRYYSSSSNGNNKQGPVMNRDDIFAMAFDWAMNLPTKQQNGSTALINVSQPDPDEKRMLDNADDCGELDSMMMNRIRNQIDKNFPACSMPLTFERFYELACDHGKLFQLIGLVADDEADADDGHDTLSVETIFDNVLRLNEQSNDDDNLYGNNISINDLILPMFKQANTDGQCSSSQWLAIQHHWATNSNVNGKCESCKRIKYSKVVNKENSFINITELLRNSRLSSDILTVSHLTSQHNNTVQPEQQQQFTTTGPPFTTTARQDDEIKTLAHDILNRINKMASFLFNDSGSISDSVISPKNSKTTTFQQTTKTPTMLTNMLVENWFYSSKTQLVDSLKKISIKTASILTRESKVLNISTPCYVLGDIHGNLKDLMQFYRIFWPGSPFINESRYLFLGDYVDRGQYGVECIIYLFCMKILAPENFYLLRGNHEFREIQKQFSFYEECLSRFNDYGLWDTINHTLDCLPISAIIDQRLFCAHGGIPITINTIEQIRSIPPNAARNDAAIGTHATTLKADLNSTSSIIGNVPSETWEILWNDPISNEELPFMCKFLDNQQQQTNNPQSSMVSGYTNVIRNLKRGTAYLFTESDVNTFCQKNRIEYIIRAHEVMQQGFYFHHQGRVITVFSSSKYSELNNRAAVVLVDRKRIRLIQIIEDEYNYEKVIQGQITAETHIDIENNITIQCTNINNNINDKD